MISADIPELDWIYELKVTVIKTAWVLVPLFGFALWLAGCTPTPAPTQWEPRDVQQATYDYTTEHYAYPPLGYGVVVNDTYYVAWPLKRWEY